MSRLSLGVGAAAVLLAGCGTLTPADQPPAMDSVDGRVLRTVVHLNGDAPPAVSTQWITAEQAAAEVTAREAREGQGQTSTAAGGYGVLTQAIVNDAGCAASSMWLQSGTNQGGSRICFTGSGLVNLADYSFSVPPFAISWAGSVQSYWGGASSSNELRHYVGVPSDTNLPTCVEYSLANRRQDTALQCGRSANYLWLGSNFGYETFGRPTAVPPSDPNKPNLYLDVAGLGRATPTTSISLNLDHTQTYLLSIVGDNPGGVRTLQAHISWVAGCTSGGLGQSQNGDFGLVQSPVDSKTAGAATYTRNSLFYTLVPMDNPCSAGWTWTGTTYSVSATAINYYGVTVNTLLASLHFTGP